MITNITKMSAMILIVGLLMGCGAHINPGHMGIKYKVLHKEGLKEKVRPEGFYWQLPWNKMVTYDVTWQSNTEAIEILTADDLHIKTDVTVTFRPDRTKLYQITKEIGSNYYDSVIRPPFITITRSEFAKHLHNKLAGESPEIEKVIFEKLQEAIQGKMIEIDRISINHIEYDSSVTNAISTKIAMEQVAEQKLFEITIAEREAEITRTRARGESDAVRINAEGEAKAIILKGKAQANAQKSITKTLTHKYLQYKAFDNPAISYYFVPIGKDGLPLIINTEAPPNRRSVQ